MITYAPQEIVDPVLFIGELWPHITLYDKQRQILYSVNENDETVVPAGNMLGKDFVAGLCVLYFFLTRHPCRVLTTSVDSTQLESVLWGEIRRFIQDSVHKLSSVDGGPLVVNHLHLRKIIDGEVDGLSYVVGRVANQTGEGMLGHHIAKTGDGIKRTLAVSDEASGLPDTYHDKFETWADSMLTIGNPFPCDNYFKRAVKGNPVTGDVGGDMPRKSGVGFYRRVIKIRAEDSPNVRFGLKQQAAGLIPTNRMVLPGVKDWATYEKNRSLWDPIKQSISLDAEFYEGSENLLFPPVWLNRAESISEQTRTMKRPFDRPKAIGVDPAEGGDSSVWTVVDEFGILTQVSKKTPDTTFITAYTIVLMREWGVEPEHVWFDLGGGGKQHVDRLRDQGYDVKGTGFGEAASSVNRFNRWRRRSERIDEAEGKVVYKNRRAELYGILRLLIDPSEEQGFGIPAEYTELRRQLAPMPLLYDGEGKMRMLPKNKRDPKSKEMTLFELLGKSPDEADSLVLATFGLVCQENGGFIAGAIDV